MTGGETRGSVLPPRCDAPMPRGRRCLHPLGGCSLHPIPLEPAVEPAPPESVPDEPPARTAARKRFAHTFAANDPRRDAAEVCRRVLNGEAAPLQAARFIRAATATAAMGAPDMDMEEALRNAEFRGRIRNGSPPLDDEEWEYAALIYDDETLQEFARWAITLDAPYPPHIDPTGSRHWKYTMKIDPSTSSGTLPPNPPPHPESPAAYIDGPAP